MGGHNPHLISAMPFFLKHYFFKNDPKNLTKVENFKNKFAFLVTILYGFFIVYCMF